MPAEAVQQVATKMWTKTFDAVTQTFHKEGLSKIEQQRKKDMIMKDLRKRDPKQLFKYAVNKIIAEGKQRKEGTIDSVHAWMTKMATPDGPPAAYEGCIKNVQKKRKRQRQRKQPNGMERKKLLGEAVVLCERPNAWEERQRKGQRQRQRQGPSLQERQSELANLEPSKRMHKRRWQKGSKGKGKKGQGKGNHGGGKKK